MKIVHIDKQRVNGVLIVDNPVPFDRAHRAHQNPGILVSYLFGV